MLRIAVRLFKILVWGSLLALLIACSAQPTEDVEDILDQLPITDPGDSDPTPTPTPLPPDVFADSIEFNNAANFTFDANAVSITTAASLVAIDQLDDDNSAGGFLNGSYSDTEYSSSQLQLDATGLTNGTGFYESRVIDAAGDVAWTNFAPVPVAPYGKTLPGNASAETQYASDNFDMTGNVMLYRLDDQSGATVADYSGQGQNLTVGGTVGTASGVISSGAVFVGGNTNDVLLVNPVTNFPTTAATAAVWVKANVGSTGDGIYSYAVSGQNNEFLLFNQSSLSFYTDGGNVNFGENIADGQWHHVVLTWDSATGAADLYIDGVHSGTRTIAAGHSLGAGGGFALGQEQDSVGGGYDSGQAFQGEIDEFAMFNRVLSVGEIQALYRRGSQRVKYQVRSCNTVNCTTENFVGPDGTNATYFSELNNGSNNLPSFGLTLANNRFFQYRVEIESDDNTLNPQVTSVNVGPSHVNAGSPSVISVNSISYDNLGTFSASYGTGHNGSVSFQLSADGATWYYFDGASWVIAADDSQNNSEAQVNSNITSFGVAQGPGEVYVKAILNSSLGVQTVNLESITITGTR